MNITSFSNNYISTGVYTQRNKCSSQLAFGSRRAEKMLEQVINAKNWKELKFTFDDVVNMYDTLGFQTFVQRSSHAVVKVGNNNFPLIMPHGKDKIVSPIDIKRLKLIALGDIEAAKRI